MSRSMSRAAIAAALVAIAAPAQAKVFLTTDEALKLAFPDCTVTRETVFLTEAQKRELEALAGDDVEVGIVHPYVASCGGAPGGVAYFDAHRVRTLPETVMIVVDPAGRVRRIEVLSFTEPQEYLPKPAWYAQFLGKSLGPELALKHEIRPIAGATLTARATTAAVRRVLALHGVLAGAGAVP